MQKFIFNVDLDSGTERFDAVGLSMQQVFALLLRPINLVYARLSHARPDIAKAFRLQLTAEVLDPHSPVWDVERGYPRSEGVDIFAVMEDPRKGGEK